MKVFSNNYNRCHCSPTEPCHVNGKPHPRVHTTLRWNPCWHGQVAQSCSEDRSSHRDQYLIRSSRVRWKHGDVHAAACKFLASTDTLSSRLLNSCTMKAKIFSLSPVALAGLPESLCRRPSHHEPPGSHGLQLQSVAGPESRLSNPLQRRRPPLSSRNGPAQP